MTVPEEALVTIRPSSDDSDLIRAAADAQGTTMTAFTVPAAVDRARDILADRRLFPLDPEAWDAFMVALDRSTERPRLARLLTEPTVFDEA
jgi:uncharacterized protein (DUF1778 family)